MGSSKCLMTIILVFLTAVSCTEKGSQEPEFAVSTTQLNAPHTLSTQSFEVTSGEDWTVSVLSEEGVEVKWAKLNRDSGSGNATITVRVYPNEYADERSADINVTSASGEVHKIRLHQDGNPETEVESKEMTVRIGTYNLRVKSGKDTGDNAWDKRKHRLIKSILDNGFDVFGVNECNQAVKDHITAELKDVYNIKFFSPYAQDGEGDSAQGVLYRKGFTLTDWHFFWLSETPDVMIANDKSGDSVYNRGGCCGTFVHNDTGVKFFVMVTHGAMNKSVRDKYAYVYIDMEKKYNPDGYPSFFVGDMNARPAQNSVKTYLTHWKDVYLEVGEENITGPFSTYNGFDTSLNLNTDPRRIDYIYYKNATPLNYVCNDKKYEGCYASDHLPIYSDMRISY